jgi:hypothetical protein
MTCSPPASAMKWAIDVAGQRKTSLETWTMTFGGVSKTSLDIRWMPITVTGSSFSWSMDMGFGRASTFKIDRSSWKVIFTETEASERGNITKVSEGSCRSF